MNEPIQLEPRQKRRHSDALLTTDQVRALWKLHRLSGKPVRQIVALGWRKWGYSSEASACSQVYKALRLEGLRIRGLCAGCGCDWDTRTRGCGECAHRHWNRRGVLRPKVMVREKRKAAA